VWDSVPQAAAGELKGLELRAANADGLHAAVRVTGDPANQVAEIQVDSLSSRTVFPPSTDYALLREELSIPGRDPVYERVLERAARLAVT